MSVQALIIAEARSWIGTPYRHQASLKGIAADCLGLVRGVFRAVYGQEPETMPAYSSDWAEAGGVETLYLAASRHLQEIAVADASAGDIMLFRWKPRLPMKHCAILVAGGRIVHAYDSVAKVVETDLSPAWRDGLGAAFRFPQIGGRS